MNEEFAKYLTSFEPEQVIISEGSEEQDFYCLVQGTVEIWKSNAKDPDHPVKINTMNEKGTYFGEMSHLLGEKRTASIIAKDHVKVLKFPGEMLPQMIVKQPKLGLKLCTALANRLKGATTKQKDIAIQRNELRDDATHQFLHAREAYQKVFVILSAIQTQMQHPHIKATISHMSQDKLMQGGRKLRFDTELFKELPDNLVEVIKKTCSEILV